MVVSVDLHIMHLLLMVVSLFPLLYLAKKIRECVMSYWDREDVLYCLGALSLFGLCLSGAYFYNDISLFFQVVNGQAIFVSFLTLIASLILIIAVIGVFRHPRDDDSLIGLIMGVGFFSFVVFVLLHYTFLETSNSDRLILIRDNKTQNIDGIYSEDIYFNAFIKTEESKYLDSNFNENYHFEKRQLVVVAEFQVSIKSIDADVISKLMHDKKLKNLNEVNEYYSKIVKTCAKNFLEKQKIESYSNLKTLSYYFFKILSPVLKQEGIIIEDVSFKKIRT